MGKGSRILRCGQAEVPIAARRAVLLCAPVQWVCKENGGRTTDKHATNVGMVGGVFVPLVVETLGL